MRVAKQLVAPSDGSQSLLLCLRWSAGALAFAKKATSGVGDARARARLLTGLVCCWLFGAFARAKRCSRLQLSAIEQWPNVCQLVTRQSTFGQRELYVLRGGTHAFVQGRARFVRRCAREAKGRATTLRSMPR